MKALYILLPILLFVLLLLFSRVRLSLVYDGRIQLRISYLFVRIPLYPRKKRRPKASAKRKNRKRSSHAQKTKIIAEAPEEKPRSEPPKKAPLRLGDIRFLLRLFREVIAHVLDSSSRHVRIRVKQLRLSIGGADDAARAAIEYGLVSQSVAYLLEFLKSTGFLKRPGRKAIAIGVDFLERDNDLSLRTDITCRLLFLIPLALSSLAKALSARTRWTRHRTRTTHKQQDKNQPKKENNNG